MDDDFTGGGFLIATEDELDDMFSNGDNPFDDKGIPGRNIKTGCYGLFLVALDQCDDSAEKITLEEATDSLDNIRGCVMSGAFAIYYPKLDIDYRGILRLAEAVIYLSDLVPSLHAEELPVGVIGDIDVQIAEILNINSEEAILDFFGMLGFNPMEIPDDRPIQTELNFDY